VPQGLDVVLLLVGESVLFSGLGKRSKGVLFKLDVVINLVEEHTKSGGRSEDLVSALKREGVYSALVKGLKESRLIASSTSRSKRPFCVE
jgi:hypothetical protein